MAGISARSLPALTTDFEQRIIGAFGEAGCRWLDSIPMLLEACEKRWQLKIEPPFPELSYNYIAPAMLASGREIILKLGVPRPEIDREVLALRAYGGSGSARLLDAEPQEGVLLLERLRPGRMLAELCPQKDAEATRIAARVMKRLWRPLPEDHSFRTIAQWARGFQRLRDHFQGGTGPFPRLMIEEAEAIYEHYLADTEKDFLLHGDLHHFNILSAERESWLAIDPKGIAGDPAYDAGALLRNPVPGILSWPELEEIQARRLDILAEELQIERRRIRDWAFAQILLSAWWSYEDEGLFAQEWIPFALLLRQA